MIPVFLLAAKIHRSFPFFFVLLLQASLLTAFRIMDTSCKIEIAVITAALFLCGAIM